MAFEYTVINKDQKGKAFIFQQSFAEATTGKKNF